MPTSCCAVNCTNRLVCGGTVKFFRIPHKDPIKRGKWISAISRKAWEPKEHSRICSDHFLSGKPSDDPTHPDFVPSVFHHKPALQSKERKESRFNRAKKRSQAAEEKEIQEKKQKIEEQKVETSVAEGLLELSAQPARIINTGINTEQDPVKDERDQLLEERKKLYQELGRLQTVTETLRKDLDNTKFGVTFLRRQNNMDELFMSFTGIDSAAKFDWVVECVRDSINPLDGITIPDQVLLTLLKLRLNNKHQDLALKFQITVRKVSRVLQNVIPRLAASLSMLINWPSKEACLQHLPSVFKGTYPRCRVIIDCTEVFIERPSNLTARAQSWSNYKHHNTMKVLVGITPTGSVSYISKCWGGRVSDKYLTQESGFLRLLEYGDQVLADRGFLIDEDVANCGAELIIPAFTKGKKQLPQRETEITRQIARVRIHVERAIGRIKNFAILKGIFPITLIPHANNIVLICSALTNLLPMLVK